MSAKMGGASTKNKFSVFGLHHLCQINFSGGNMTSLTYSADGKKLKAVYAANTISPLDATTPINSWSNPASESVNSTGGGIAPVLTGNKTVEYVGNLIYENGVLKQMLVEGGYVSFGTNNAPTYHFYIQDHLGNNRVVVSQSGTVEQVNHYYPYGGLIAESTGWNVQRYKYNGNMIIMEEKTTLNELRVSQKEINALMSCPSDIRYQYTIKRIADTETIWTLGVDERTLAIQTNREKSLLPIWSSKEYAMKFGSTFMNEYSCIPIPLDYFEENIIDIICENNYLINVFPTQKDEIGEVVDLNRFSIDLSEALSEYN